MTLGERLKEAREFRGVKTQRELATLSGVSESTISKIECNNGDAKASTLNLLNEILHINLNWLINGKGKMIMPEIPHYTSFKELLMRDYLLSEKQSEILVEIVASNSKKEVIELWSDAIQGDKSSITRLKDILKGLELANG